MLIMYLFPESKKHKFEKVFNKRGIRDETLNIYLTRK